MVTLRGVYEKGRVQLLEPVPFAGRCDLIVTFLEKKPRSARQWRANTRQPARTGRVSFVGMWKDRDDMADSAAWVRQRREAEWQ